METVNEGSTAFLSIMFRDKDGAGATPSALWYTVQCMTTGQEMRATTNVTPAETVELVLNSSVNAINNAANPSEIRRVTVTAQYGVDDYHRSQYDYAVRNLSEI